MAVLMQGAEARRDKFLRLAADRPSVIHLATHVLTPNGYRGQAFIAFGLDPAGEAEYLSTSDVAMLRVPGALVIMTGCQSGGGEIRAGAGLLGLTRAWQIAGAKAVVATAWPVRDSKGEIFKSFYRYLREAPPADALRRSQLEMIRSGTWRAAPGYWASYQITGGAR
jgi:CHAT domain-containing protein